MANTTLPPGFRFHPTDEELIMYYLKRKVTGRKLHSEAKRAIPELNIRLYAPWELPGKSRSKDLEWYFFCPIEKKYASGSKMMRANETGYWKVTGKDRTVTYKGRTVGKIKTLIFYQGHGRKAIRTDWVIHEYRMEDKHLADARIVQDSYVICKVFEKTGSGPKNGSQYGGPFIEEDWDNDDVCAEPDLSGVSPAMPAPTDCQSCPVGIESTSNCTLVEPGPSSAEPGSSLAEPHINELPEDADMIELLCPFFMEENGLLPIESNNNKNMSDLNQARCVEIAACNDGDDIYNGLGGLEKLPTLNEDGFCNIRNPWEETSAYYGDSDAYINQARSVEISECNDGDDMFNSLGDLGNLLTPGEDGFPNMTMAAAATTCFGDTAGYMELDDLMKPLDESNCGSETQHLYASYNNVEQSHIRGNTTSGSNPVAAEENIHPKPIGYNSW